MKQIFLYACLLFAGITQGQNGVYTTNAEGYFRAPLTPTSIPETIHNKFVISVDISSFSEQGQIIVKNMDDGSVETYTISSRVKDSYELSHLWRYYMGYLTVYGLTQDIMITLSIDSSTNSLNGIVFTDAQMRGESHYSDLIPLEETLPSTGSGFIVSEKGFVVTNYHVIKDGLAITVTGLNNDFQHQYGASLIAYDETKDIALLKVDGISDLPPIPYTLLSTPKDVGDGVFVLGYPLLSTMGYEVKLTDGLISATSGFEGDPNYYQVSAPVQPGNSGGPLFDSNGNVIGIVSAKHTGAENVGYAIKSNLLVKFLNLNGETVKNSNKITTVTPLSAKVKELKKYVVIIKTQR